MNAYIKAISYYLPDTVLTNEQLAAEFPEWSVEKVASKIGIAQRHIVAAGQTATDMAVEAAEKLFAEHNIARDEVDFVLLCTQSPDYLLPTSACILQHRLGLATSCGALDFNLGCSGFVYGLALAKGLVVSGIARNVLLITSETYTKHIHPKDKGNRTIFGDAAAATLVSNDGFAEIGQFSLGTDGSGAEHLMVKSGGMRQRIYSDKITFDENNNPISDDYLYMNGNEIFNFTQDYVPQLVNDTLCENGLTTDDINLYVFHQANMYMLNFLRKKMKIAPEQFYCYMERVGNTVSSTIPIALYHAQQGSLLTGNTLLAGFGVGLSTAGVVISAKSECDGE